ncbi:ATP-binding cassette domain-containing protein [Microbacterium caowuchunii]|uniref:Sugar ABC transporter ATP-binding protein n=1 Tax=Microbacterium caowuchunii TaxID=2614638 RepID=A0A5N0T7J4_9MICO|nr:ATP-binding cassette domain-containing protein [Microbacterium caowuchunii]KAA9130708.1 sugar ABC transporter ATP-binding protein [Microbacterium caowuchunii]
MTVKPTTAPAAGRTRERVVTMRGIGKRFGAVRALTDVDFWVDAGEVVALIGDNGAGKSTLVNLLAGVHTPDTGTIEIGGAPAEIGSPADAQAYGVATVFQDLALCDNLDVVANLWLGRELVSGRALDEVDMEQRTWTLLRELSAKLPSVRVPVASLSGGQRQTVAIARSLLGDPRVVILDEPTAALGVAQTAEVLNLIERLRERGHGVVLISHHMADVLAVADRVVVLRLGRNNGVYDVAEVTSETLIAAITGASDLARPTRTEPHRSVTEDPADVRDGRTATITPIPRRTSPRPPGRGGRS